MFKNNPISNAEKHMAKKKTNNDFNMSDEIRKLLRAKRTITGREVYDSLVENFPKHKINKNSCSVAFYKMRMETGVTKKASKKKAITRKVVKRPRPSAASAVDINALQSTAMLVAQIGNSDEAIVAIKQLESVQIR